MSATAMGAAEAILTCDSVWKAYGPDADARLAALGPDPAPEALAAHGLIAAVRNVSLAVRRGEILVLMGLSGSGKSTLVRCMTRLVEVSAGAVMLGGINLTAATERELIAIRRGRMGMVFQNYALMPHMTALENVAFPMRVQGIARAKREARAREMLALVGLEGREEALPRELSGGMQQRVGIARSLTLEPEVWFLDEPFSALDPLVRREMQDEFLRLQTMLKKTIVFVTHDFSEAVRLADRIAIMKDGAIVQLATPEVLVTAPADEYVAAFTRDIPRAAVVTARSAMDRPASEATGEATVEADVPVGRVAARLVRANGPVAVLDGGRPIGAISPGRALDILLSEPGEAAARPLAGAA